MYNSHVLLCYFRLGYVRENDSDRPKCTVRRGTQAERGDKAKVKKNHIFCTSHNKK